MKRILAVPLFGNDADHFRDNVDKESRSVEQLFSNISRILNELLSSQLFNIKVQYPLSQQVNIG